MSVVFGGVRGLVGWAGGLVRGRGHWGRLLKMVRKCEVSGGRVAFCVWLGEGGMMVF